MSLSERARRVRPRLQWRAPSASTAASSACLRRRRRRSTLSSGCSSSTGTRRCTARRSRARRCSARRPPSSSASRATTTLRVERVVVAQRVQRDGRWRTRYSIASGRLSFSLGLHGPCVSVDTACSSGLVAHHSALRALQLAECTAAVAAGVNLMLAPHVGIAFATAGMTSARGRCHTFERPRRRLRTRRGVRRAGGGVGGGNEAWRWAIEGGGVVAARECGAAGRAEREPDGAQREGAAGTAARGARRRGCNGRCARVRRGARDGNGAGRPNRGGLARGRRAEQRAAAAR